jgi:hypothetical protein
MPVVDRRGVPSRGTSLLIWREDTVDTNERPTRKTRVIAEMNAAAGASEIVRTALAYCQEHDAELVVVWVVDPALLRSPYSRGTGAVGTWGLVGPLGSALGLVRGQGVRARAVVRVGERSRVLEEERAALGPAKVFTFADVPVPRCPACGARLDPRGIHHCPTLHLDRTRARRRSRPTAPARSIAVQRES